MNRYVFFFFFRFFFFLISYDFAISDITPLQAIQLKRNPLFDFDLGPGDLLFFPPGIIHATRVVSDACRFVPMLIQFVLAKLSLVFL